MNPDLTKLQLDILQQVAGGYATERILLKLALSFGEYRREVEALKTKLEARSLQEAVVRAHDLGLIDI